MTKRKGRLRGRWFSGRYESDKCRVSPCDRDHVILNVRGGDLMSVRVAAVELEMSFADMRAFCLYGLKLCDQEEFGIPGGLAEKQQ